jgi:hypothetical protein
MVLTKKAYKYCLLYVFKRKINEYFRRFCGYLPNRMEKKDKKRSFREQLKNRYRLVVLNDDTFEEKFALRLTPLGLLILFGSVTIIMTFLVISLVAFTPFARVHSRLRKC